MKVKRVLAVLLLTTSGGVAWAQDKGAGKGPSDPQIAGIVVAANQIDIDAGELAKSRTKTREIVEFAQRMITDHTAGNKEASALVKKLNVTPEDSETSRGLKASAKETMAKLKGL
jgi:putative membrane protein